MTFISARTRAMTGMVESISDDARFICPPSQHRIAYKVTSEMQCVHRCLNSYGCGIINYNNNDAEPNLSSNSNEENCEIYAAEEHKCTKQENAKGWKAILFKRKQEDYESCSEIFNDRNQRSDRNGIYKLKSGDHFCLMDEIPGCGSGGWTLAMKVNGSKVTFLSESAYWQNKVTYNVENGLKSLEVEESKFPAFSSTNMTSICFGMKFAGVTKWIRLTVDRSQSLLDLFKDGNPVYTSFGRDKWKSLIADASLQANCNREGVNVKRPDHKIVARIGIFSNQENNCDTPDSFIGVGLKGTVPCNVRSEISCGNFASCSADNGDKRSPAMCYLLVQ
eukprot:gene8724-9654_t